ncbi:DUF1707 domain-containing protein [Virgisporangium ochraceum]|uniref:DUF1707 domain-containing protein n=1 Tax=Virgisporangium ochraceum TaxID=65505 RepID=A0A8J4EH93_9ACTN|nr:DUF1707 domain-containing protein [Virgisporangium ochraceum]GIJ71967.1 hypothetical protein Voc01_068840 [Virgisporangium ochraceum]
MGRDIAERRRTTVERLDVALAEGRLTTAEHRDRVAAAYDAHIDLRLAELVADLPARAGEPAWTDAHRVRALDLHHAAMYLGEALTTGALTPEEYRKRLTRIAGTLTYATLKRQLDGVPGPPGPPDRGRLLVTDADRRHAAARIDRALADDRLTRDDHAGLGRALQRVRRYRDLDRVLADLTPLDEAAIDVAPPAPSAGRSGTAASMSRSGTAASMSRSGPDATRKLSGCALLVMLAVAVTLVPIGAGILL